MIGCGSDRRSNMVRWVMVGSAAVSRCLTVEQRGDCCPEGAGL